MSLIRPSFMFALVGIIAFALTVPVVHVPSATADEIEEIVVTAQKREESLQETPVSVTAFTAEALAEIGAVDMDDLAQSTPGLHSHANAGGNTGAVFGIRGITRGDPESMLQPRTSLYVDGVYVAKSAGALFDIVDLERVEVLRGPQGALYGRNTTGGAINLITKRPTADKEFRTKLYGGNEEDFRLATMFNTPLLGSADALLGQGNIGTVNARVSMSYQSRDGHIENSGAGSEDFDMRDRFAGRAAFQWEASDDLTIDYTYENHTIREEPTAFHVGSLRSSGNSWAALADLSSGGTGAGSVVAAANYLNPTRQDSIHNSQVMLSDGTTMVDLANDMDINAHSVVATQELGDLGAFGDATFKAITAIREVKNTDAQDLDGMPAHMAEFKLDLEVDTVSEELQLTGNTMDGRLDYVLGAFYYSEEGTADNSQVVLFVSRNDQGNDWLLESYAAYGHASYVPEFDDRFTFGAGVRYTKEESEVARVYDCRGDEGSAAAMGGSCAASPDFSSFVKDDWDNVSPMGSVSYRLDDNKTVYGKISRGFTSGGFNGRAATAARFQVPFDEETLTAYEVGIKSRLHDNRVMLNASVYYNDYKDQQVTVFEAGQGGAVTRLDNAGESEIKGGELELVAIPYDNTTVSLAYSYTDAEYTEYTVVDANDSDGDSDYTEILDVSADRAYALTPESTVSASVTHTWPGFELFGLESSGLTARLNYYWQDEMYFASTDYDLTAAGSYGLLNASLKMADIECKDGVLDLVLWGKNLTDKKYEEHGIDFGSFVGIAGNIYGAPLTAGLEMIYTYGG